jgi:shikimate dehydrogenase
VKRFAVIGDPVAHSKSPAMHAAAYRALGLDCRYEAIRVPASDLPAIVQRLRDGEYDGFNVTVPHKQRVVHHVDDVDPSASDVGAANTLVRGPLEDRATPLVVARVGVVRAYNTDVAALRAELVALAPERSPEHWAASRAIVVGSGGAAKAAVAALRSLGVSHSIVRSRRDGNLAPGAEDAGALTVVQATSAGMDGADPGDEVARAIDWRALPGQAIALDVVYAPPETPFLRAARARGVRAANGLGMLARQGALAFELWLGVPAPLDVMRAALT